MKKTFLTLITMTLAFVAFAQQPNVLSSIKLDVNTFSEDESSKINQFIDNQRRDRSFMETIGKSVLKSAIKYLTGVTISEIMDLTEISQRQEAEWSRMIQNECHYEESLTYINNLTDFYSKGSSFGALDPSNFSFNGFTLNARHNGQDVLFFYSHVDTSEEGLNEIINHSKFRLVLDSMYFYPYRCHLPNLMANHIYPDKEQTYARSISFNYEERENLMVNIDFTITSSWYNQAILLSQDVELGSFSIQVPIDEASLTDGVFIYKRGDSEQAPLNIDGSCFIVPRSYMPLTGGVPHWGTGEYNVYVTLSEDCDVTSKIRKNWREDFRQIRQMKKQQSIWPSVRDFCVQKGTTLLRISLESASETAIKEWDWINER